MKIFIFLLIHLVQFVLTAHYRGGRVLGGFITSIAQYPSSTAILHRYGLYTPYVQFCGGTIINQRYILSAAHCFLNEKQKKVPGLSIYRIRVGSSTAHRNGYIHSIKRVIVHPDFNVNTYDSDVVLLLTTSTIVYSITVQPGVFADFNYELRDNEPLWAIGWGYTAENGKPSETLRHVQVWSINQKVCQRMYEQYFNVTDNVMCSGFLKKGGRDQCIQDSGSPLYHNGTVVGIASLGIGCGNAKFPGINVRISRFSSWILGKAFEKNKMTGELSPMLLTDDPRDLRVNVRVTVGYVMRE